MIELMAMLASFVGFVLIVLWSLQADANEEYSGKIGFFAIRREPAERRLETGGDDRAEPAEAVTAAPEAALPSAAPSLAGHGQGRKRFLPSR
jgi:hypothetical protein